MLALVAITFATSYIALQPHFAGWSERDENFKPRFEVFENRWGLIFTVAGVVALVSATLAYFSSDQNPYVGYLIGTFIGLLGIPAWTDAHVFKVPLEISKWTLWLAMGLFFGFVFTGLSHKLPILYTTLYPRFDWGTFWPFAGGCVAVALIGFLLAVKSKGNTAFLLSLAMMFMGLYLAGYALIASIETSVLATGDSYWIGVVHTMLIAYVFLGVAAGYDLFLPRSGIGGADTLIFYTVGFAFSWWVTPYLLFVALLVAFFLQLMLHLVAKPLDLGYLKTVKNSPIRQMVVNGKAKRKGVEPATTHEARAVPFVPMLVAGTMGSIAMFI
jgi:hypothetical protein